MVPRRVQRGVRGVRGCRSTGGWGCRLRLCTASRALAVGNSPRSQSRIAACGPGEQPVEFVMRPSLGAERVREDNETELIAAYSIGNNGSS